MAKAEGPVTPEVSSDDDEEDKKKRKLVELLSRRPSVEEGAEPPKETAEARNLPFSLKHAAELAVETPKDVPETSAKASADNNADAEQIDPTEVAALSELTPDENREVVSHILAASSEQLPAEPGSVEDYVNAAEADFTDRARALLADESIPPEAAIQQAKNESLNSLDAPDEPEDTTLPVSNSATPPPPPIPPTGPEATGGNDDDDDPSGSWASKGMAGMGTASRTMFRRGSSGVPGSNSFNTLGNMIPESDSQARERTAQAQGLIIGGIIGYLIGRRRGRIKTEKKLLPVQKQLENKVKALESNVVMARQEIRDQANKRARELSDVKRQSVAERLRSRAVRPAAQESVNKPFDVPKQIPEAMPVPLAVPLETARDQATMPKQPEFAQRPQTAQPEKPATMRAEAVAKLDHRELLEVAEKIVVDGTSLRTIFEANQITEPGLRRITGEYLRGGDIKKALKQEVKVKEMAYERDPLMRDRLAASYANLEAASPQASQESLATLQAKASEPTPQPQITGTADDNTDNSKQAQRVLVSVWGTVVVVLVIIALVLLMR